MPKKEFRKMAENESIVITILKMNGLGQYADLFRENKIDDLQIVASLTDDDLIKMGITVLGDRKKIRKAFLGMMETKSKAKSIVCMIGLIIGIALLIAVIVGGLMTLNSLGFIELTFMGVIKGIGILALLVVVIFIIAAFLNQ